MKIDPHRLVFDEKCYPCIVSVPEEILQSIKIENESVIFDENMFIVNKMSKILYSIDPASYIQYAKHLFRSYKNKVTWRDFDQV